VPVKRRHQMVISRFQHDSLALKPEQEVNDRENV
jgi:hypothetical protein